MRFIYSTEMNDFIKAHREGRDLLEVTALFNERFGTSVSVSAMRSKYKALHLRVGTRRTVYTDKWPCEVVEFFQAHNAGRSVPEMTALLNETFGMAYTESQVRAFRKNHRLPSGCDTRFRPGQRPWSAGKRIEEICRTPEALERVRGTHYRKGHSPHNQVPVGTEVFRDGYWWVKTGMPNHWRAKHRLIYEQAHGVRLRRGDVVMFLDGNAENMDPDNLVLVSNRENQLLNHWRFRSDDPELTRTGLAVVRLHVAVETREREHDERKSARAE